MIQTRLEILPEILRVLCSCLRSNKDFIPPSCKSKPDLCSLSVYHLAVSKNVIPFSYALQSR